MPCVTPIAGYKQPDGKVTLSLRLGYVDRHVTIACGQCIGCRLDRASQWAVRIIHEVNIARCLCPSCGEAIRSSGCADVRHALGRGSSFVTLTYSPQDLPKDLSLSVSHWQKFAKRLRRAFGPFRFFHAGEYGDVSQRPHYHAIIIGLDFSQDRVETGEVNEFGDKYYVSEALTRVWGLGHVLIGDVTLRSAAYVARYCLKKATGPEAARRYRRFDSLTGEEWYVKPEYCTMSRNPGLGNKWYSRYRSDLFPSDKLVVEGKRRKMPRYYDSLLEASDPAEFERIRRARRARVARVAEDLTPDRLAVKGELMRILRGEITRCET